MLLTPATNELQAYHGGLQHVRDPSARASRVSKVVDRAAAAVDAIGKQAGLQCRVVTGGGSGTYRIEAASGVFTEVQPGRLSGDGMGVAGRRVTMLRAVRQTVHPLSVKWC